MWLCYFHALQKGDINKVVPIDKSSTILTILTILMALIFLHEGLSWEKAVFASLTALLGKIGISGVDSNLGTAIRTTVVLVMVWLMVFMKGKQHEVS